MNLRRSDLYRLVWSHPGVRVAEFLGVSSSALTKICRRTAVPAPARGHWRRCEVGLTVTRPALPDGPDTPLRFVVDEELERVLSELPSAADIPTGALVCRVGDQQPREHTSTPDEKLCVDGPDSDVQHHMTARAPIESVAVRVEVLSGPTFEDLVALSQEHRLRQDVASLIDALDHVVASQPTPVAAVMALWLHRAKEVMRVEGPVDRIVDACRSASWREMSPPSR